jgi:hypothetical protein
MAERVRATGLRLFLVGEVLSPGDRLMPRTPEERADHKAEQRGEVVFVAGGGFCDCEDDGREYRLWDSFIGERSVRIDHDPTSELLEIAESWRENIFLNLQHDVMYGGEGDTTRWEFASAPFSIELSDGLRKRLAGAWKDREPHRLPGESEPDPPRP